jgi:hypothetical protein
MPRSGVPLGAVIGETTVIRYLPAPHPLTLALLGALLAPLGAAAQSPTSDLVLPTLQVEDDITSSPYAGKQTLDASYIANQPAGNGDIGSLLKINPAVQYDNGQLSSFTPGEISPAEVSINGAAFYQNNFSIDGIGMNNGIDPAADPSPYRLYSGPGSSQAFALDTRLLGELTVLDSNISAAWGGFTGGVIDATTRKPSRQARSEISTQMSRSSWTRYHVNEAQRESHANASAWGDGQPEFEKTTWRVTTEGWLSDDLGMLASYSRKRSTIPTMFYSSHLVEQFGTEKREQTRAIDNLFVKAVWEANERIELQASLMYAPQEDSYYRSNIVDSQIDISNGGLQANLQLDWRTDWGQIDQQLGLTGNEQSRHGHSDDYYAWIRSDSKDWGTGNSSLQGEYGQVEQEQRSAQYKLDVRWDPIATGSVLHRLSAGAQLGRDHFDYTRLTESSIYVTPKRTSTCTNAAGITDTTTCALGTTHSTVNANNGWAGQFFSSRTRYAAGAFDFTTLSAALYVEDDMRIGDVSLRGGLRVERDDYMSQTTLAPRLAASWDVDGDGSRLLQAGVNRYYGRSVARWRLQENINRLRYNGERRTTLNDAWTLGTQAPADNVFNQLDIAYDDELMLGFSQRFDAATLGLKFINRLGRDQVIQAAGRAIGEPSTDTSDLSAGYTTWTNDGRSHNQIWSLTADGRQPLRWAGTTTVWQAALDWTDQKYASPSYEDDAAGNLYYDSDHVQYLGQLLHRSQLPTTNYTRPWTARLTSTTAIPQWNLSLTHFLRYRAGYRDIGKTGEQVEVDGVIADVYDRRDFSATFNWDVRISWEKALAGQQAAFLNLDIFNLLNRENVTSLGAQDIPQYETGRSFWVELGYRF